MKKRILVVGDLHVGSIHAVMPDEVWVERGDTNRTNCIKANRNQTAIFTQWCRMVDNVGRVDACYVMGDCCDGPNRKSSGFELWTSNLHQQVTTAADLLSMIKTRDYYGVQGSYYHVGENTSSDLAVIDQLKGTFGTELVAVLTGPRRARIHLAHEIGWSRSPVSKATAAQSEIASAALNDHYFGQFDLVVRAHRHEWLNLKTPWGHVMVVPGWKIRDAFGAKKGLSSAPGFMGYGIIEYRDGDLLTDIHSFTLKPDRIFKEVAH